MTTFKKNIDNVPAIIARDGTILKEILHPKNDGFRSNYSLAIATLKPGTRSYPHILRERSELYIIQRGEATVFIDGHAHLVTAGDVILIPAGSEQYVVNAGKSSLDFWCIVSPPWAEEDEEIHK